MSERTVTVVVKAGRLGNTRKVSASQVEVDADKGWLRVSKNLLDSRELNAVKNLDSEVRRYLYDNCLPFEPGTHLLPVEMIERVDGQLAVFAARREELVAAFLEAYPALCAAAAERLRVLYNPVDYPPVEAVRAKFFMTWQYVSFGVPGQLAEISRAMFDRERDKAADRMNEAAAEIQEVLREAFAELVAHMADRLTPGPDGKPKVFQESSVAKLRDFLETFDFRNVTDDAQLAELVERARGLLGEGVTAKELRESVPLRDRVRDGLGAIKGSLDQLVVSKPVRKFRVEDESEAAA